MQVLLWGDADRREMQPVVAWLTARTKSCHRASSIAELSHEWFADLIVVLESHPDEFSAADIDRLAASSPLARIVCCAGGWSESAGRTRKIWPLAVRVPATTAIARLEREWSLLTHADLSLALPPTGSREEWFVAHHAVQSPRPRRGGEGQGRGGERFTTLSPGDSEQSQRFSREADRATARPLSPEAGARGPEKDSRLLRVAVISPDPHYRQMLIHSLAWHNIADEEADVILWDVDPWSHELRAAIQSAAKSSSIIALANWITPEWEAELLSCGVKTVVSKLGNLQRVWEATERPGHSAGHIFTPA